METSYLSGKVWKRALPVFDGPAPLDAPILKRMKLNQGELAQVYDDPRPVHYIALIELRAGTARGNHFHKKKAEAIYLTSGEISLLVEDVESKLRTTIPMVEGDLVYVPTGVAHTLQVVRSGLAVEYSEAQFDPGDTYRYVIS